MSVYKYIPSHIYNTNAEKIDLLKYIFVNKTLRFSSPLTFNDPFELRPYVENLVHDGNDISQEAVLNHFNDTKQAHKFHDSVVTKLSHDIGIFCLSGTKDNLVMWGNYADNHKGIVVEFDKQHPFFNPNCNTTDFIHKLKRVVYDNQRISMNSNEWGEDERTFLAKSEYWEYEDEYRMPLLLKGNDNNPNRFNIEFPSSLIKSIYIGCKATKETNLYIQNLKTQEEWKHLDIYNMIIDEKEYRLNSMLQEDNLV